MGGGDGRERAPLVWAVATALDHTGDTWHVKGGGDRRGAAVTLSVCPRLTEETRKSMCPRFWAKPTVNGVICTVLIV